jgi:hypothetical protein
MKKYLPSTYPSMVLKQDEPLVGAVVGIDTLRRDSGFEFGKK